MVALVKDVTDDYADFLVAKAQSDSGSGFEPLWVPDFLFDFQKHLVTWAIRQGRAALYAECGMGKTPMQLVWAQNVVQKTGRPVLIITPLAVGFQTEAEAAKFGVEAAISRDGRVASSLTITNYERLEKFNPDDFAGVVCDESSAIKDFSGIRRALVTEFMRTRPYRLLCTATAAPNDYVELGTSSEALGYLGHMDMLSRFFVNQNRTGDTKGRWRGHGAPRVWEGKMWRFKGHAEEPFWRWVSSWARALRKPSDLGFEDGDFILPPVTKRQHIVTVSTPPTDRLFEVPAIGLREERDEMRRSLPDRCEKVIDLVTENWEESPDEPWILWVQLNDEQQRLEDHFGNRAFSVHGSLDVDEKERRLLGFMRGERPVLITKPTVSGYGLNLQFVARMTFFPSHSFEQYYQAIRRCWRFGQKREVMVDIVTTEGGVGALANIERKEAAADRMFDALVAHMKDALHIQRSSAYAASVEVPSWL